MQSETIKFAALIFAITIACYFNSLQAGFVWDDYNNIVESQRIGKAEGFKDIFLNPSAGFYRPISYLSLKIDWFFWQNNPFGYHLSNILFHIINSILVFLTARFFIDQQWACFITAGLFAAHPVHTEAVAYISGRSDSVAGMFVLLSIYLYLIFLRDQDKTFKNNLAYSGSLLSFVLAVLSKEIALILPIVVLVYNLIFGNKRIFEKIKSSIPFFAIGIALILLKDCLLKGDWVVPIADAYQSQNIFKILLFYLSLMFAPFNLHMQRSLADISRINNMSFILSTLIFGLILCLVYRVRDKQTVNFGLSWFLIWLFPFWGILQYSAQIAEHWLYIPSIGVFLIIGRGIAMSRNKIVRPAAYIAILILALITIKQNAFWKDDLTLYQYTLRFKPYDVKLNYNLGNAFLRKNMLVRAERSYLASLKNDPDYVPALNNLAIVYEKKQNPAAALRLYKTAVLLEPKAEYISNNLLRFLSVKDAFAQENSGFDHSLFQKVLDEYAKDGWVDYKRLLKSPIDLYQYLYRIENLKPAVFGKMSRLQRQAIYINAYNAFTIQAVLDNYPVRSIRDIPGVWDRLKFKIAQTEYTLDEIEHQILRPKYNDPRIHFALVCAAQGCPRLGDKVFTAADMDEMLEYAGKSFLQDKTRNWVDKEKNVLYLSKIFTWFKEDFGDIIEFISQYMKKEDVEYIKANAPRIKYTYNWDLNERK